MASARAWPPSKASESSPAGGPRAASAFPCNPLREWKALGLKTLTRRAQFQRVQSGAKWVAKAFILQGRARPEGKADGPRFGFAVSSRALAEDKGDRVRKRPGAVLRNRARRRLKEAVRLTAPHHARPDFDYVVIGRREALHQSFADLLEDMQLAFIKVHRPPRAKGAGAKSAADLERATGSRPAKT
jgi:ribonuclease P protein component